MGMWVFEHRGIKYTPGGSNRFLLTPAEFVLINAANREEAIAYIRQYDILDPYSVEWGWSPEEKTCRPYEDSNALRARVYLTSQYVRKNEVKNAGTIFMIEHYSTTDIRNTYDFDGSEFKFTDCLKLDEWRKRPELATPTFTSKPKLDLKDWGLF